MACCLYAQKRDAFSWLILLLVEPRWTVAAVGPKTQLDKTTPMYDNMADDQYMNTAGAGIVYSPRSGCLIVHWKSFNATDLSTSSAKGYFIPKAARLDPTTGRVLSFFDIDLGEEWKNRFNTTADSEDKHPLQAMEMAFLPGHANPNAVLILLSDHNSNGWLNRSSVIIDGCTGEHIETLFVEPDGRSLNSRYRIDNTTFYRLLLNNDVSTGVPVATVLHVNGSVYTPYEALTVPVDPTTGKLYYPEDTVEEAFMDCGLYASCTRVQLHPSGAFVYTSSPQGDIQGYVSWLSDDGRHATTDPSGRYIMSIRGLYPENSEFSVALANDTIMYIGHEYVREAWFAMVYSPLERRAIHPLSRIPYLNFERYGGDLEYKDYVHAVAANPDRSFVVLSFFRYSNQYKVPYAEVPHQMIILILDMSGNVVSQEFVFDELPLSPGPDEEYTSSIQGDFQGSAKSIYFLTNTRFMVYWCPIAHNDWSDLAYISRFVVTLEVTAI